MGLATRFGSRVSLERADHPMDNNELYRVAPSIFAAGAHDSRSERYTYIPTIEVIEGLRDEGFFPFAACQGKTRIEGKADFTKHMLRLRRETDIVGSEANEIILINSHDGTSSYQMLAGVFRFVCCNGMLTGDIVDDVRVRHSGNIIDNVIDAAYTIVDQFDTVSENLEIMKSVSLSEGEARAFGRAALALKYDQDDHGNLLAPISSDRVLLPRRREDSDASLWSRFNVVQENLMRGGQQGRSASGRNIRTRPVQSIDTNVKLNKALWILADEMAKLKMA